MNEALCSGIPVICSNEVGAKALINNGVNGSVVNAHFISELSEAISAWLIRGYTVAERLDSSFPSLMPIDFDSMIDELILKLDSIVKSKL